MLVSSVVGHDYDNTYPIIYIFLKSDKKCGGVPPPPPPPSDFSRQNLGSRRSSDTFCPPPLSKHPGAAPACTTSKGKLRYASKILICVECFAENSSYGWSTTYIISDTAAPGLTSSSPFAWYMHGHTLHTHCYMNLNLKMQLPQFSEDYLATWSLQNQRKQRQFRSRDDYEGSPFMGHC